MPDLAWDAYSCTHMATVDVKGLKASHIESQEHKQVQWV